MDIIFNGEHDSNEAGEYLMSVLRLFRERYHVGHFKEMHLSVTLLDDQGEIVELVDTKTEQVYRTFEVCRSGDELRTNRPSHQLKLVVDNTR